MENQRFEPDADSGDARIDQAIAARLGKLRSMPVDTSQLDRLIQQQIPPVMKRQSFMLRWSRPMRAVAASLLLAGLAIVLMLTTSGGPVVASTSEMARFHDDMVSGRVPVTRVDSVKAVNAALASEWANSPQVPNVPNDHVMACCMRSVQNKRMACVLLEGAGKPVTMTVAKASDMRPPASPVVTRNGVQYHVETVGKLNMVMTERQGRWICLISEVSSDRLMDLAGSLEF
jgi:hypothetical protein